MADYNIYIHSTDGSNGYGGFTTPWTTSQKEDSPTTSWVSPEEKQFKINDPLQTVKGQINNALGGLAKAIPQVAIAYGIIKGVELAASKIDNVVSTTLPFYEAETGDFYASLQYQNMKNVINAIKSPFQTALNLARTFQTQRLANQRRSISRELLGDSIANTYTNRGI